MAIAVCQVFQGSRTAVSPPRAVRIGTPLNAVIMITSQKRCLFILLAFLSLHKFFYADNLSSQIIPEGA